MKTQLVLLAMTAGLLTACGPNEFDKYLVRQAASAMDDVIIENLKVVREANEVLKLAVKLRNESSSTTPMQAKVIFFDQAGFEIDPYGSAYKPIVLESEGEYTLNVTAPNPRAESFKIHIREQP